ncbi:outer membrane beta-barrel protein [Longimicrobium sp.]|uniref:outer membrane beta-barrel protein n=1 Tax=Longimicrobium sp. TaxID=2029185 RepID=UPI002D100A7F|nr:outer membrane beta-barrel protein [Longimicrobium sp.]HSU13454.1 outer membrane beta-barrel protein [Longimicrobium sp.]
MNKLIAGLFAVAATAVLSGPARAQIPHVTPFAVEARVGAAFPTGDFNDVANTGVTLNGNVTAYVIPTLGIYAGYYYTRFGRPGAGHYTETGPEVGLRLDIPTPDVPLDPYVRAGLVWNRLELTGAGAQDFSDSSPGFQINAGVALSLGRVSLAPGFTYVRHTYDTNTDEDQTASYIRADIGVRIRI